MTIQNISKSALIFLSVLILSSPIWAQRDQMQQAPPQPSQQQIMQMVLELGKDLSLSEKQSSQMTALYQSHFQEIAQMMNQKQRPARQEMDAFRMDSELKVKTILTPEQAQAFDEFQKSHGPQSHQQSPNH